MWARMAGMSAAFAFSDLVDALADAGVTDLGAGDPMRFVAGSVSP